MNKNIRIYLKNKNGFTTIDIVVSVLVIIIFIGIIATLFYNFYLSASSKNRNAIAINCIIDVIEQAKIINYDELNNQTISELVEKLKDDKTIPSQYTVNAEIQKYNETEGNTDKKDLIKILKVQVQYNVGQKAEKIEISTLITK